MIVLRRTRSRFGENAAVLRHQIKETGINSRKQASAVDTCFFDLLPKYRRFQESCLKTIMLPYLLSKSLLMAGSNTFASLEKF